MEGFHCVEGDDEPYRPSLEPQADVEAIIAHHQPAKLELQDDGRLLRILRKEIGRQAHAIRARVSKAMLIARSSLAFGNVSAMTSRAAAKCP